MLFKEFKEFHWNFFKVLSEIHWGGGSIHGISAQAPLCQDHATAPRAIRPPEDPAHRRLNLGRWPAINIALQLPLLLFPPTEPRLVLGIPKPIWFSRSRSCRPGRV